MSRCHSCPASAPRMMISLLLVLSLGLHTCNCKSSRLSEVFTGKGAARVVFIPASVASHYYQFRPIIRELAARGHQLQVLSAAAAHLRTPLRHSDELSSFQNLPCVLVPSNFRYRQRFAHGSVLRTSKGQCKLSGLSNAAPRDRVSLVPACRLK